jgi:drug/metabolite transporter (DMT)-like permease
MLLIVGGTATVGQIFLTRAFATGTPAKVSIVALTQVVFSMVIELVVWQRPFGLATLLGFALVLIPTAWVLLRR